MLAVLILIVNSFSAIPVYPKKGVHPRLFISKDKVPELKQRFADAGNGKLGPVWKSIHTKLMNNQNTTPVPALLYLVTGDKETGRNAVQKALGELNGQTVEWKIRCSFSFPARTISCAFRGARIRSRITQQFLGTPAQEKVSLRSIVSRP